MRKVKIPITINPKIHGGGLCGFCPLLKISVGNPYQKILDLSKLFVADTPMKEKITNLVLLSLRALCNMWLIIAHA